jgi:hypothetical protein
LEEVEARRVHEADEGGADRGQVARAVDGVVVVRVDQADGLAELGEPLGRIRP